MTDQPRADAIAALPDWFIEACANPQFPGGGDGRLIASYLWPNVAPHVAALAPADPTHCLGCDGTVDVGQMSGRGDPCPGLTAADPTADLRAAPWERWRDAVRRHPDIDGLLQRADFTVDSERLARAIRTAEVRSQMDAESLGSVPAEDGPLPDWYRAYAIEVAREYAALASPTTTEEET